MAQFLYDTDLRAALMSGIRQTLKVVAPNYGPTGKNTLIQQRVLEPQFFQNGSAILQQLALDDPYCHAGLELVRSSALRLGSAAGDGATLVLLLAGALIQSGTRAFSAGMDPMQLRKGILAAAHIACETIRNHAKPLHSLDAAQSVAKVASSDSEIAQLIRDAFEQVGLHGIVTTETTLEPNCKILHGGIRYEYGYANSLFANDETGRAAKLEKPYVLLVNHDITDIRQLLPILQQTLEQNASLLIIAKDIKESPLAVILNNVKNGKLKAVVANGPGHGETRRRNMEALSARIGSMLVEESCGIDLKNCGLEICGRIDTAVIEKYSTVLSVSAPGAPDRIRSIRNRTEAQMKGTTDTEELEELNTTLGILNGDSAKILVGGNTHPETDTRKKAIDNALFAVYTAAESGILPGGGKGLLLAVPAILDLIDNTENATQMGAVCIREALLTPARVLADNAGYSGSYVTARLLESKSIQEGFDASTGEFCDLLQRGILDPAGTVCSALEIAAETAASILTVQAAVLT